MRRIAAGDETSKSHSKRTVPSYVLIFVFHEKFRIEARSAELEELMADSYPLVRAVRIGRVVLAAVAALEDGEVGLVDVIVVVEVGYLACCGPAVRHVRA